MKENLMYNNMPYYCTILETPRVVIVTQSSLLCLLFFSAKTKTEHLCVANNHTNMATAMTPREHIEDIRKTKFSIGEKLNPLTEDLHQAVKNLSGELYAKDVHFFMELVQVTFHLHGFFLPS